LPGDLPQIDRVLEDERFFEPFRPFFDPIIGRPSIPMETSLRMMFPKYRDRLGFEPLCREVSGLHRLAALLSCAVGPGGAASRHADEDHLAMRGAGGERAQRGAAGQGG